MDREAATKMKPEGRERVEVFGDAMGDKSGVLVPCPTVR
jgi:hypothetical protein